MILANRGEAVKWRYCPVGQPVEYKDAKIVETGLTFVIEVERDDGPYYRRVPRNAVLTPKQAEAQEWIDQHCDVQIGVIVWGGR